MILRLYELYIGKKILANAAAYEQIYWIYSLRILREWFSDKKGNAPANLSCFFFFFTSYLNKGKQSHGMIKTDQSEIDKRRLWILSVYLTQSAWCRIMCHTKIRLSEKRNVLLSFAWRSLNDHVCRYSDLFVLFITECSLVSCVCIRACWSTILWLTGGLL